MSIIEVNYEEATEIIWRELAEYGSEKAPELFADFNYNKCA